MSIKVDWLDSKKHVLSLTFPANWTDAEMLSAARFTRNEIARVNHEVYAILSFNEDDGVPGGFFQALQLLEQYAPENLDSVLAIMDWQTATLATNVLRRVVPRLVENLHLVKDIQAAQQIIQKRHRALQEASD